MFLTIQLLAFNSLLIPFNSFLKGTIPAGSNAVSIQELLLQMLHVEEQL